MNFLRRLGAGFKSAGHSLSNTLRQSLLDGRFARFGRSPRGGWLSGFLPGSKRDWETEAGNVWDNSAVSLLLRWFCNTFCESPLVVQRAKKDGTFETVPLHPLAALLKRPNKHFTRTQLLKATLLSRFVDGNAYWFKGRSGAGKVVELWWIPHWMIEPRWTDNQAEWLPGGDEFISYYEYRVDGVSYRLAPRDIVHFREGVDPTNYRKGLAPLRSLLREICTDNQILTYTYGILKNGGVPPAILTPKSEKGEVRQEFVEKTKAKWKQNTTGDNAGDVMVMNAPWDIQTLGFSPEDLSIEKMGDLGEARLAGAFGLPPVTVSLLVGLRNASAKASHKESKQQAYESGIMPVQRDICEVLDLQLLPELGNPNAEYTEFDTSRVVALQEDANAIHKRADDGYKAGTLKRSEARALKGGLISGPEDEIYFTDLQTAPVAEENPEDPQDVSGETEDDEDNTNES